MKATLIVCAAGAALLFGVSANAGEPDASAAAAIETPSEGAPVDELTDPTAGMEATVEGEVAPEGEGDIDADAEAEVDAEATVEGEVAPEGEGDIDADAAGDLEADAEADAEAEAPVEAAPETAEEPNT